MLDAVECAQMVLCDVPRVNWHTLQELRLLLTLPTSSPVVQHQHFPHSQGVADETVTTVIAKTTTESVPAAAAAHDLGNAANRSSGGSEASAGSDVRTETVPRCAAPCESGGDT